MNKIFFIIIAFTLYSSTTLLSKKIDKDVLKERKDQLNSTKALYKRGLKLYMRSEYSAALTHFQGVVAIDPNNFAAWNYLGGTKYHLGDYNGAIANYNRALKLKPNTYYIIHNRGFAYHTLDQHKKAIKDYSDTLKIRRNYFKSIYFRGMAYYEIGNYDKAINDFLLMSIAKPHNYKAKYMMGLAKYKKGNKKDAQNYLKQARIISNMALPDYSENKNPFSIKKKTDNSKDKAF